jgi:hypothetical protein
MSHGYRRVTRHTQRGSADTRVQFSAFSDPTGPVIAGDDKSLGMG